MNKILFADDEEHLRRVADQSFKLEGLSADLFCDASELLPHVSRDLQTVIVTDIKMPKMGGVELLKKVMEIDPTIPVILITGHGDVDLAVSCMRDGAYDFLEKPYAPARLIEAVKRGMEKRSLILENRSLLVRLQDQPNMKRKLTGASNQINKARKRLQSLAPLETDVLIMGETGTGKNVAAQTLHDLSARCDRPFVQINCAAIPRDMVEIELFGYEPGAFSSAVRTKYGKFEYARGGTVFLDEVEALDLDVQAKLLNAVQERQITRLGANEPVELDVRFVSASKKDLKAEVAAGRFRSDLYYRLAGAEVQLPSLSERPEDIPSIFSELVQRACHKHKRDMPDIKAATLNLLIARKWPGNVRELNNVAERFVLGIDLEIVPDAVIGNENNSLADQVANFERAAIVSSLSSYNGKINPTFQALGISRKALYDKMQKYGLNREDFSQE